MKKFITSMVAIVIGMIAFALPTPVHDASEPTTTRIPLRYNRESASKQKRMPSYDYDEKVYCWYDGEKIYFDLADYDIIDIDLYTLKVTSNCITNEFVISHDDMNQGITIGLYDTFELELIIPGGGCFQGYY